MKKIIIITCLLISNSFYAQQFYSIKNKTASNTKDRTMMLDIFRAKLYEEYKIEMIFVVDKFNVSGNYAWFASQAKRKDGREIKLQDDREMDCCHVEALFKKSNNKWLIVESGSFTTDVWYDGIWNSYNLPQKMFFQ